MILLPAIDILGGQAVRLARGAFDARTDYDADPLDAALRWVAAGARALHIVDLDGARSGQPANLEHVRRIAAAVQVPVQVGGGLRSLDAVRAAAQAGAARVVLGTAALRDVDLLDAAVAELGDRVVVSLDAREGKLASDGWLAADRDPARVGDRPPRGPGRAALRVLEHRPRRDDGRPRSPGRQARGRDRPGQLRLLRRRVLPR